MKATTSDGKSGLILNGGEEEERGGGNASFPPWRTHTLLLPFALYFQLCAGAGGAPNEFLRVSLSLSLSLSRGDVFESRYYREKKKEVTGKSLAVRCDETFSTTASPCWLSLCGH